MVALSTYNKERVYFHLGYASRVGIDAADISRLEQACNEIYSDYLKEKMENLLDIADQTYEQKFLVLNDWYDAREIFQGDINRASRRSEPQKQQRIWQEEYLRVTEEIAKELRVTNYNTADSWAWTHERNAGGYIQAIPGPADTAIASRIAEFNWLGSGAGD
jgi:hypothetical protein